MPGLFSNGTAFRGAAQYFREQQDRQWQLQDQQQRQAFATAQDERNFDQQKEYAKFLEGIDIDKRQQIEDLQQQHYTERAKMWDQTTSTENAASSMTPSVGAAMQQVPQEHRAILRDAFVYGGPMELHKTQLELMKQAESAQKEARISQSANLRDKNLKLRNEHQQQINAGGGERPQTPAQQQHQRGIMTMAQTTPYAQAVKPLFDPTYETIQEKQISAEIVQQYLAHPEMLKAEDAADLWFKSWAMPYEQRAKLGAYVIQKQAEINAVNMGQSDSIGIVTPGAPATPSATIQNPQPVGGAVQAQQPANDSTMPSPQTPEEYQAIPHGTHYRHPDGTVRFKQ